MKDKRIFRLFPLHPITERIALALQMLAVLVLAAIFLSGCTPGPVLGIPFPKWLILAALAVVGFAVATVVLWGAYSERIATKRDLWAFLAVVVVFASLGITGYFVERAFLVPAPTPTATPLPTSTPAPTQTLTLMATPTPDPCIVEDERPVQPPSALPYHQIPIWIGVEGMAAWDAFGCEIVPSFLDWKEIGQELVNFGGSVVITGTGTNLFSVGGPEEVCCKLDVLDLDGKLLGRLCPRENTVGLFWAGGTWGVVKVHNGLFLESREALKSGWFERLTGK